MKRIYLFFTLMLLLSSFTASAQFGKKLVGNNKYVTITKETSDFSHLVVWPKVNVYYKVNPDSVGKIRIHGEENVIHLLDFSIKKNRLEISFINNMPVDYGYITIHVYSSGLSEASVEGSGVLELQNSVKTPDLKLGVGGGGQIIAKDIQVQSIKLHLAGSGDMLLNGHANTGSYTIAGSGDIRAKKLEVEDLSTKTAGSGNIFCYASKNLKSRIVGSGSVFYYGKPQVKETIIGSGVVGPIPDNQ